MARQVAMRRDKAGTPSQVISSAPESAEYQKDAHY